MANVSHREPKQAPAPGFGPVEVRFSCRGCSLDHQPVMVRLRCEGESLSEWVTNGVIPSIVDAHTTLKPICSHRSIDLFLNVPQSGEGIGKHIEPWPSPTVDVPPLSPADGECRKCKRRSLVACLGCARMWCMDCAKLAMNCAKCENKGAPS